METYFIILFWDDNPDVMTPFSLPDYTQEDDSKRLVTFATKEAAESFAKDNLKGTDVVIAHIVSEMP